MRGSRSHNRILRITTLAAICICLLLLLAACGKGGAGGSRGIGGGDGASAAGIAGHYDLETMDGDSEHALSEDVLELMRDQNLTIELDINEDGTATLYFLGEELKATFNTEEGMIEIDGSSWPYSEQGGKLMIDQDDYRMIFVKAETE